MELDLEYIYYGVKSALDSIKYHTRVMSRLDPFMTPLLTPLQTPVKKGDSEGQVIIGKVR